MAFLTFQRYFFWGYLQNPMIRASSAFVFITELDSARL